MTKVCVKCGSIDLSARGDCMPCKRVYDKAYRAANKEKVALAKKKAYEANTEHYINKSRNHYHSNKDEIAVKNKIYREENKDAILDGKRVYRQKNKEKIAASEKEYYEKNKEYVNQRQKEYVERNKESVDAKAKAYRIQHAERLAERSREWLKNNKERAAERQKKYYAENPEVYADARSVRRSRQSGGRLTRGIFTMLLEEQGNQCPGCLVKIDRGSSHLDHFMPLSLGGKHEDSNVQLLCASCNLRKHATHPQKWLESICR